MKTALKRIHPHAANLWACVASVSLFYFLGIIIALGLPIGQPLASAYGQPEAQLDSEDPAIEPAREAEQALPRAPLLKPDPHQAYLKTIQPLCSTLFRFKHRFEQARQRRQSLPLQVISASSQTAQNQLSQLERQYQEAPPPYESFYQLQQAVKFMQEAVSNAQQAKQYNSLYRPSARDARSDSQLFSDKIEAAIRAIETVEQFMQTHHALQPSNSAHP